MVFSSKVTVYYETRAIAFFRGNGHNPERVFPVGWGGYSLLPVRGASRPENVGG